MIPENRPQGEPLIELKDVWFRYSRDDVDVIKASSLKVEKAVTALSAETDQRDYGPFHYRRHQQTLSGKGDCKGEDIAKQRNRKITENIVIL